ncbi:DUF488 domain-containing protein [Proteiniclasticum sp. C24MP]|uniref:DUF488 domain-containing protein n=1 Tax=Proteiniclasticum sp. C24MP TaxID=3374101 RepID=UPI0037541FD2
MHRIHMRRIYEEKKEHETRILVDRLWPRGVSKEKAGLEYWAKEMTPSDALRKAYHEGALEKEEFREKYRQEILSGENLDSFLSYVEEALQEKDVVLLSAVKDLTESHVPILKEILEENLKG